MRCASRPEVRSASPKVLEPVRRQFGIPDRVLNVLVPEVVLQGPGVMAIVGELEPSGVAKHVRVDREWHLGGLAEALNEPVLCTVVQGGAAAWSASRWQCRMEAPGRVRGMRRQRGRSLRAHSRGSG